MNTTTSQLESRVSAELLPSGIVLFHRGARLSLEPTMKRCTKCKVEHPATLEFFKSNHALRNGLHSHCRACCRKSDRLWHAKHQSHVRRRHAAYRQKNHGKHTRYMRKWLAQWPERAIARNAVRTAKRNGHLVYSNSCDHCGKSCKPVLHHPDYSHPLEVVSLCISCHAGAHRKSSRLLIVVQAGLGK